jgi:hypothetical protein
MFNFEFEEKIYSISNFEWGISNLRRSIARISNFECAFEFEEKDLEDFEFGMPGISACIVSKNI